MLNWSFSGVTAQKYIFRNCSGSTFAKSDGSQTPGTLQMRQSGVLLAACEFLKFLSLFLLKFFGHLARSAPQEDHHCVIAAALRSWVQQTGGELLDDHETPGWQSWWGCSALELWGPCSMEEGKRWGYFTTSHQYGNALIGVCHRGLVLGYTKPLMTLQVLIRNYNRRPILI